MAGSAGVLLVMAILAMGLAGPPAAHAQVIDPGTSDTTPPALVELDISPETIDSDAVAAADRTITLTIRVTDDLSGWDRIACPSMKSGPVPGGSSQLAGGSCGAFSSVGPDSDATNTYKIVIPRYAYPGTWTLDQLCLSDRTSNQRCYSAGGPHPFPGDATVTVTGTGDIEPPTLVDVSISPETIDSDAVDNAARTITVTMRVTDALSGWERIACPFMKSEPVPGGSSQLAGGSCGAFSSVGPDSDATNTYKIVIPRYAYPGTWTLDQLCLADRASNRRCYQVGGANPIPGDPTVTVTGTGDIEPPTLVDVTITPDTIDADSAADADRTVTMTMRVTDGLSGWNRIACPFFKSGPLPDGSRQTAGGSCGPFSSVGPDSDATNTYKIVIPRYAYPSTWTLDQLCLFDRASNGTCYAVGGANPIPGDSGLGVVDTRPPTVTCAAADSDWHAANVAIPCTATDTASGVVPADASFSLLTTVAAGVEDANASTVTREICDRSGNCTTAGPVAGNKVDRKGPAIAIAAPVDGATLEPGSTVPADYACADLGSGLASCVGDVAVGSPVDTTRGPHSFSVTGTDAVGNVTVKTVNYQAGTDSPPVAADDSGTVAADSGATALGVLSNDADAEGDAFDITFVTDPANGTASVLEGTPDRISYTPDAGYCNTQAGGTPETFTYTVTGGDTATVTVTVTCKAAAVVTVTPTQTATPATTATPSPAATVTPSITPPAASPSPLACSGRSVVLIYVGRSGTKVQLTGLARKEMIGQQVAIREMPSGKRVGTATVGAGGAFDARVPAPSSKRAATVRYDAQVGTKESTALRLARQLTISGSKAVAGGLRVSGQMSRVKTVQTIRVTRQTGCKSVVEVTKVRTDRSGRFSVTLARPVSGVTYYRMSAKVGSGETFTLPIAVGPRS